MKSTFRKMRLVLALASILSLTLLAACQPQEVEVFSEVVPSLPGQSQEVDRVVAEAPLSAARGSDAAAVAALQERLIIRNAALTITAADPPTAAGKIQAMANELGGFVVSSEVSQHYYTGAKLWRASVMVRVPAEQLDEALDRIRAEALTVEQENVTGRDVTDEYTDLQSRLRNQQATEVQLLEIMSGATKTQDVLDVQRELTAVREQIEVLQGRINYLEQSAAFSEIRVEIEPDAADRPLDIPGWNPKGVVRDAVEAMIAGLQTIATAVIWFVVYVIPVCILPATIVGGPVLWWYLRRRKMRREAAPAGEQKKASDSPPSQDANQH